MVGFVVVDLGMMIIGFTKIIPRTWEIFLFL